MKCREMKTEKSRVFFEETKIAAYLLFTISIFKLPVFKLEIKRILLKTKTHLYLSYQLLTREVEIKIASYNFHIVIVGTWRESNRVAAMSRKPVSHWNSSV